MTLLATLSLNLAAHATQETMPATSCGSDLSILEEVAQVYPEIDRALLAEFMWVREPTPGTLNLERFAGSLKDLNQPGNLRVALIRLPKPNAIGLALAINFASRTQQEAFADRLERVAHFGSVTLNYETNAYRRQGDVIISVGIGAPERVRQGLAFIRYLIERLRAGQAGADLLAP